MAGCGRRYLRHSLMPVVDPVLRQFMLPTGHGCAHVKPRTALIESTENGLCGHAPERVDQRLLRERRFLQFRPQEFQKGQITFEERDDLLKFDQDDSSLDEGGLVLGYR